MAESQSVKNTPGRLGVMPGWLHSGLLPRPKCKSRRSATQGVLVGRAEGVLFLVSTLILPPDYLRCSVYTLKKE